MQQLRYISVALIYISLTFLAVFVTIHFINARPSGVYRSPVAELQQPMIDKTGQEFIAGKELFTEKNCRACHRVVGNHADLFISSVRNEYWANVGKIADFLRDPESFSTEPYIVGRMKIYGIKVPHISYPNITDEQVSLIYKYIILADLKNNLE